MTGIGIRGNEDSAEPSIDACYRLNGMGKLEVAFQRRFSFNQAKPSQDTLVNKSKQLYHHRLGRLTLLFCFSTCKHFLHLQVYNITARVNSHFSPTPLILVEPLLLSSCVENTLAADYRPFPRCLKNRYRCLVSHSRYSLPSVFKSYLTSIKFVFTPPSILYLNPLKAHSSAPYPRPLEDFLFACL